MEGEVTFECNDCNKIFTTPQLKYEAIPDNISLDATELKIDEEKGIPKCPHCGYLGFFGFKIIDIAF